MLAVKGVYENGKLFLQEKIKTAKPIKVIVTFLEEIPQLKNEKINLSEFSFNKSKQILKNYKGSLCDAVI